MSLAVNANLTLNCVQTLEGPFVSPSDATVTINALKLIQSFTGATAVPVTKVAAYELTLSSGTGSVNLAALPGLTSEETIVGTGLKVQFLVLKNKTGNANKITVTRGASTGYGLCASGDAWTVVLSPDQMVFFYLAEAAPDVASGARLFDVTGTGSQVLQLEIVLG